MNKNNWNGARGLYAENVRDTASALASVRACRICGHSEIVRPSPGAGRGYGMREGNKARGRMIQHLKSVHGIGAA